MKSRAVLFAALTLAAACESTTAPVPPGAIRINTITSGLDADVYVLKVDDSSRVIGPTDETGFPALTAGPHVVQLTRLPDNCSVQGENPRTIQVVSNQVVSVQFDLTCVARTGNVEITTQTTGLDNPPNFEARIDGVAYPYVAVNGVVTLYSVTAGAHAVELRALGSNCSAAGGATRNISVSIGTTTRDTARVRYDVTCTAAFGVLEVTFNATTPDFGDGFQLKLGSLAPATILSGTTVRYGGLSGDYLVALQKPATCTAVGPSEQTVTVKTGGLTRDTVRLSLAVQCTRADKIAFVRGSEINLVTADGSKTVTITEGGNPFWSPDGSQIVFSRGSCDYYYGCYYSGLFRRSTAATDVQITTSDDDYPTWSPDGQQIAFLRHGSEIFVASPEGAGATRVPLPNTVYANSRPVWSPDGTRLLFGCGTSGVDYKDVCVVNVNGTGFTYLTTDALSNGNPMWSPDGTHIVFERMDFPTDRVTPLVPYVAIMNANGSGITRLVDGRSPGFSRDGTRIVYTGVSPSPGIWVMNANGTGATRLTTNADDRVPTWQP